MFVSAARAEQDAAYDIEQIVQWSVQEGWLAVRFTAPAKLLQTQPVILRISGSGATWSLRIAKGAIENEFLDPDMPVTELIYHDSGDASQAGHVKAVVCSANDYVGIMGTLRIDGQTVRVRYRGRADIRTAQLEACVQEDGQLGEPLLDAQGESLQSLADENPLEFHRYLEPVLKKLSRQNLLGPGAADMYAAFPSIQPDAGSARMIRALLGPLDSPNPKVRERASHQLAAMGAKGVLAAMRFDRRVLSPEQRARLNEFVASHRRRWMADGSATRNIGFLVECLEADEPQVRQEAKRAIEQVLGRSVKFDPAQEFDDRWSQVESIRRTLQVP